MRPWCLFLLLQSTILSYCIVPPVCNTGEEEELQALSSILQDSVSPDTRKGDTLQVSCRALLAPPLHSPLPLHSPRVPVKVTSTTCTTAETACYTTVLQKQRATWMNEGMTNEGKGWRDAKRFRSPPDFVSPCE